MAAELPPADRPVVIGTAGHVDHGKTVLVRALTGVDTDRLPDEKRRGISIDLGFAPFTLPGDPPARAPRPAAIVDVPGHERFIKNMLAGVTGIDLAMLVVAADEGVMPQTREHLDILRMLGLQTGLVVITKTDLVDAEWLELVTEDVRATVRGTFLEGAPIVPVSAVTGAGLPDLLQALAALAERTRARDASAPARLPVDRVFTVAGFGTVVTGTLVAGTVRREDRLELLPAGLPVRVRGVQVHDADVTLARAGQRVAVNLAGVEKAAVTRGDVLAAPGEYRPGLVFEGRLECLATAPRAIGTGDRVRLYAGTAEVLGRLVVLEGDALAPGASGYVRFRAEAPLVVAAGDRFIVRAYSPVVTIGGGVVLDPAPRRRRPRAQVLADLQVRERGDPAALVQAVLGRHPGQPLDAAAVARATGLDPAAAAGALAGLEAAGQVIRLEGGYWLAAADFRRLHGEVARALDAYHGQYPMRRGIPKEELRNRVFRGLDARRFGAVLAALEAGGACVARGDRVARAGFAPAPPDALRAAVEAVRASMKAGGANPPAMAQVAAAAGLTDPALADECFLYLADQGELVRLAPDAYLHRDAVAQAAEAVREVLRARGAATTSELRDALGTTRRYVVPLLEYFDAMRLTRRVGDRRELVS